MENFKRVVDLLFSTLNYSLKFAKKSQLWAVEIFSTKNTGRGTIWVEKRRFKRINMQQKEDMFTYLWILLLLLLMLLYRWKNQWAMYILSSKTLFSTDLKQQ